MKGQTATEYLMTYGWAILIFIVVVSALYSMGIFQVSDYDYDMKFSCELFCYKNNMTLNDFRYNLCACKKLVCDKTQEYRGYWFIPKCEWIYKDFNVIK